MDMTASWNAAWKESRSAACSAYTTSSSFSAGRGGGGLTPNCCHRRLAGVSRGHAAFRQNQGDDLGGGQIPGQPTVDRRCADALRLTLRVELAGRLREMPVPLPPNETRIQMNTGTINEIVGAFTAM